MKQLTRFPFYLFHAGYAGLAVALQSLFVRLDPKPERRRALEFFRNGVRLRAMKCEGTQDYPVYVINRAKDKERLQRFSRSCRKWGIHFQRVEAVNCADPDFDFRPYEKDIAETFYGKTQFLRGAVGCFLSHSAAWRKLLESDFSHAVICEDDAVFLGPIPRRACDYQMPEDFDLVYLNQRLSGSRSHPSESIGSFFQFSSVFESAKAILTASKLMSAPGGEGYLLSRRGAGKILRIFQEMRIYMEVDWFLFFHSLSLDERSQFIKLDQTGRFDMLKFSEIRIHAAALMPSLVEQRGSASTIGFDNPENYISRKKITQNYLKPQN
jgi:glycosyl transferase family 25